MGRSPVAYGGTLAVLAAVAFGAAVPFTQRAGHQVGPFATAAWLYGGACAFSVIALLARPGGRLGLTRADLGRTVVIAVLGAALAPTLLAWGLQRVPGTTASLLLNFEALFTVLLARVIWRESFGRRVTVALTAMLAGGALLVIGAGRTGGWTSWGGAAVITATLAWAAENVFSRPLAERDPFAVVFAKSALGAGLTGAIALLAHDAPAPHGRALQLLACGATGYGLSLALYLQAQRRIGAARTASIFALAPFVGAMAAWTLGDRQLTFETGGAAALLAFGVALHLTERHRHRHLHAALVHAHAHRHDDGHHLHTHDPPVAGEHAHPHEHAPLEHDHEHAADLHHD